MTLAALQPSFGAGELAPELHGRVDLAKYKAGAALLRNFVVDMRGGALSRPGTQWCGRASASEAIAGRNPARPRLIRFVFSTLQAYALEFGHGYMRVWMNGGVVTEPAKTIGGVTRASPAQVTAVAHGFGVGQPVAIAGVKGMTEIVAASPFLVRTVPDADHVTLNDLDGNAIDSTGWGAWTSGGTIARIFTLGTPYVGTDLPLLKYTQSADTMTLTHPSYDPYDLTRTQHWAWTLTLVSFAAQVQPPIAGGFSTTSGAAPVFSFGYLVTAETDDPPEESVACSIINGSGAALNQNTGVQNTISWAPPASGPTPARYRIYKALADGVNTVTVDAQFGQIGISTGALFADTNIAPDFTKSPPTHRDPFAGSNNPGCSSYFQQRKTYAASLARPQTLWLTKPASFKNMDVSSPSQDDDAITLTLFSREVNAIKHLVPMPSGLVVLTGSGAWQVVSAGSSGNNPQSLTPASADALPQSYNGASDVPPLVINNDILYVQERGSIVRDLAYNFYAQIYTGTDRSQLAPHLFAKQTIAEWCWAEEPYRAIWAVRGDGILLCLTFVADQDVYPWTHHDTDGFFRSAVSIPEAGADAVYFVTQRYLGGKWIYGIERLAGRQLGADPGRGVPADVRLAWCLDAALALPLTGQGATLTPPQLTPVASATGKGPPLYSGSGVFATSADVAVHVGDVVEANGGVATIIAVGGARSFTATVTKPLLHLLPSVGGWSATTPVTTVSGLGHLEGRTVGILADGNVVPSQVVAGGKVTLPQPATRIVVGLPYTCQLQTLPLDLGTVPSVGARRKDISSIDVTVADTRGLKTGPDFLTLRAMKEATGTFQNPPPLFTGVQRLNVDGKWRVAGQVAIQQDFPLPAQILAVTPELTIGDDP